MCVVRVIECAFVCRLCAVMWTNRGLVKLWVFIPNSFQILLTCQSYLFHPYPSLGMLFNNKLFITISFLLSFTNLQLVIPGRTWILLYLDRTMYKHLWACLALYGGPRWTLCQFQRGRSNNKQIDSFYFILFYYFILGYFWLKTGVGQTSPEWIQTDPDESSHYQ